MARVFLTVLLIVSTPCAWPYQIDFTGTMRMNKTGIGNPAQPDVRLVPFEVVGDTESLDFLTMSIWVDGNKLTHPKQRRPTPARWKYSDHLHQWEAEHGFGWNFRFDDTLYNLHWSWVEISTTPNTNPIEEFPNFSEGPWYFFIEEPSHFTEYFTWPEPGIVGVPRKVPEPAPLLLLAAALTAVGFFRRTHRRSESR